MKFFLILGVLISCRSALAICTEKCNEPTLLYDSLQCSPIFSSSDDCCPSKYNCSIMEGKGDSNDENCYFEGKAYKLGEKVNDDDIMANCQIDCSCRSDLSGTFKVDFTCAIYECGEALGYTAPPGCYLKDKLGECCQVGPICTKSDKTCLVEGKTIKVDTMFNHPTEKCTECMCDENFKGEFKEPFCKKLKCIEEITNQKQVYGFCAPSYISLRDCCPYDWICPKDSDKIESASTTSENKCKFGSTLLNIGDKFSRTKGNGKVSCECRIPPYLTCIQNYEFTNYNYPSYRAANSYHAILKPCYTRLFFIYLSFKFIFYLLLS